MTVARLRAGVALHECLVAVLCVAVMGGLMVWRGPAWAQEARKASCQESLRQLGIAIRAYTMDMDDYLPQSVNYAYPHTNVYPDPTGKLGSIAQSWLVNGGYTTLDVMRDGCPEYPQDKPKYWKICGYSYNAYLGRYNKDNELGDGSKMWYRNFPAARIGQIKNPGAKFIMGDTVNYLWLAYISDAIYNDWRHDAGANFLYFDGQVKNHPKTDFSFKEDKWDKYDPDEISARLWPE